ncbi:MAG: lipoyl(octanoyl) transferase LipB [Thermoleophilaceae bacterium]|nr:lipoyl(octanoyl) transferase LipB [Thermoleophilaceae bacterium]
MADELWVAQLGVIEYATGVVLQERIRSARQAGDIPDVLLLLEHEPVYTRGRRSAAADLPMGEAWYRSQGIAVSETDRGGKVTYHGPGQLVGYPIMAIGDVHAYVRSIEAALITALAEEGITAGAREGLTGVWVQERKIGSVGLHVQRGITTHGFSVNVDGDLQPWEWIVPCGIENARMTSILRETKNRSMNCFRKRAAYRFAEAFGRRQRLVSLETILAGTRAEAFV